MTTVEPRKKPRQDRSQGMVERILDAAGALLADDEAKALTTNAIAARAGLSVGSLYQYFPNKEAIVLELTRRWLSAFTPISAGYLAKERPRDWAEFQTDFEAFTRKIAATYQENRSLIPTIEAMQSHPDLRRIGEEHDRKIIDTHAAWLMKVDPGLAEETAIRVGILLLSTGHIAFAEAAARRSPNYDLLVNDVITMHVALLGAHMRVET